MTRLPHANVITVPFHVGYDHSADDKESDEESDEDGDEESDEESDGSSEEGEDGRDRQESPDGGDDQG